MGGYAALAPALFGGPPGWVVWAVGGTALTVAGIVAGKTIYDSVQSGPVATTRAPAVPTTQDRTCGANCARPYTIVVHAQGIDCGGTTGSTIGAPPIVQPSTPIPTGLGIALSAATMGMLGRRQRSIRTISKLQMDRWIRSLPPYGFLGPKTFPATDPSGGKRLDLDSYGPSQNFIA